MALGDLARRNKMRRYGGAGDIEMTPELEASLISRVGDRAVGGIAAVGNILDLPGSSIRDVMTWAPGGIAARNPLDQWLPWNWTSPSNRTTGRELLQSSGMISRRKTGLGGMVAGIGAEMALDPLTYITLGGSAMTRAGTVMKNSGLMDDVTRVAARKANVAPGMIGKRQARVSTTFGDMFRSANPAQRESVEIAARKLGVDPAEMMDQNLGGLMGIGLPFQSPSKVLGQGASRTAKAMDDVMAGIQYAKIPGTNFSPVNDLLVRPFDATVGEASSRIGQAANRILFQNRGNKQWEARHRVAQFMTKLEDLNLTEEQYGDVLRQSFEIPGASKNLPPELRTMVKEMRKDLRRMPDEAAEFGIQLKDYIDPQAAYFPRYLTQTLHGKNSRGVPRVMSTLDPSQSERLEFLHGIQGGTVTSKNVFLDKNLNDLIDNGADTSTIADEMKRLYGANASDSYVSPGVVPEIKRIIRSNVPDPTLRRTLLDSLQNMTAEQALKMAMNNVPISPAQLAQMQKKYVKNRFNEMAKWYKGLTKETRDTGVFGNHPLADLQARLLTYSDSIEAAKVFTKTLSANGVATAGMGKEFGPTVKELLTTAKLQSGTTRRGALKKIAQQMGHDVNNMAPDQLQQLMGDISNLRVKQDIADDMVRMQKGFSQPDSVSPIIEAVQNVTNFYKSNLTSPFPAFHVRNLFSGQFQNWVRGMFDAQSVNDANTYMHGGTIKGAKDIPALQRIWRERQRQYGSGPGVGGAGGTAGPSGGVSPDAISDIRPASIRDGQPIPAATPSKGPLKEIGNKEINQWTPDQIQRIADPAEFSKISPAHKQLNDQLQTLIKQRGILPEDAEIMRLVYAQSKVHYLPQEVAAMRQIKDQYGRRVNNAFGIAEAQLFGFKKNRIVLQSASRKTPDMGAATEGTRVLLHELGHILSFDVLHRKQLGSASPQEIAAIDEFLEISKTTPPSEFYDEFFSSRGNPHSAKYHSGQLKSSGPNPWVEQFAEFFAESVIRRKVPKGAIGTIINNGLNWLRNMLDRLRQVSGLKPSTRSRLDAIMDELGGFNAPPDISSILNKGKQSSPNQPPVVAPPAKPPVPPAPPKPQQPPAPQPPKPQPPAPPQPPVQPPVPPTGNVPPTFNPQLPPANPPAPAELDDETATRLLAELTYAYGLTGKFQGEASNVVGKPAMPTPGQIEDMLTQSPSPVRKGFSEREALSAYFGMKPGTTWNPLHARGVGSQVESRFGPLAGGEQAGYLVEGLNRVAPFLNLLRKGVDPAEAARRIGDAQVNYANRHYTRFERDRMSLLLPFYKFSRGMIPHTLRTLAEAPGGRLAQTVRTVNSARDVDALTPDYVSETASIPLNGVPLVGNAPEGTQRYLTGLGLMFEDPMSFMGGGARGAGLEFLSRTNPLVKAPLEWATGESFFQKGPRGGRDLEDLDPTLGRMFSNIGQMARNPDAILSGKTLDRVDPVRWPGSDWMEFVLGNTPLARVLTTARAATDPRKSLSTKAVNLLTGVRISDVSPEASEAIVRERTMELMKDLGSKEFVRPYFPQEMMDNMTPEQQMERMQLQAMINNLAAKAKARAEAAESQANRR